ncbi:MAG: hypothetical protein LIO65_04735 [Odoribacter sp.]|nr:hypothetical protein [Odoribacter sp.]
MRTVRLLIILSAFLIMISSVFTVMTSPERTAVWINVAAMFCLVIAITFLTLQYKNPRK